MRFVNGYSSMLRAASRPIKLFLVSTVIYWLGMTLVQLYLNFFLQGLGLDQSIIGLANAVPNITIVILTLVIGGISTRIGPWRGAVIGTAVGSVAVICTALSTNAWQIILASVVTGVGSGFMFSNTGPFIMAHSSSSSRATLFSVQSALATMTGFVAYLLGGQLPRIVGGIIGQPVDSTMVMRVVLLVAAVFYVLSLVPIYFAGKSKRTVPAIEPATPSTVKPVVRKERLISNYGLVTKLLFPGVVISLGAGMTMPFMNIYIEQKFNVNFENLGQIFAFASIATAVALLIQPVLADRMGKVKSVIIVQGLSLPFLLVLGYGSFFPLVIAAMFVRGALMNMGNPVFTAFSLEQVRERERATFSSMSASMWSLGWAAGAWFSGVARDTLGFTAGFNLLFGLMAVLYAVSMVLTWIWFVGVEDRQRAQAKIEAQASPQVAA